VLCEPSLDGCYEAGTSAAPTTTITKRMVGLREEAVERNNVEKIGPTDRRCVD
jgi:hypothetical protein